MIEELRSSVLGCLGLRLKGNPQLWGSGLWLHGLLAVAVGLAPSTWRGRSGAWASALGLDYGSRLHGLGPSCGDPVVGPRLRGVGRCTRAGPVLSCGWGKRKRLCIFFYFSL
jgi:hypothetical protein